MSWRDGFSCSLVHEGCASCPLSHLCLDSEPHLDHPCHHQRGIAWLGNRLSNLLHIWAARSPSALGDALEFWSVLFCLDCRLPAIACWKIACYFPKVQISKFGTFSREHALNSSIFCLYIWMPTHVTILNTTKTMQISIFSIFQVHLNWSQT